LRDLTVTAVEPMGSAVQLLVQIAIPASIGVSAAEVLARLHAETPRLRHVVAGEICRKRTPMLHFVLVPGAATQTGGPTHE